MDPKPTFNEENFTSILEVRKNELNLEKFKKIAKEKGLHEKQEFHLTIIGRETGEKIKDKFGKNQDRLEKIKQALEEGKWDFSVKDEFYFITKKYEEDETRKSIIQMVEFPGLKDFYKRLNPLLSENFETPLPHITLFTTSNKKENLLRGIGIYSKEQFTNLKPQKVN